MHKQGLFLGLILFSTLMLVSQLAQSAAQVGQLPNPLVIVSNQGQAGPNVDQTLVRSTYADPALGWNGRFFDPDGWQDAYPVMRAITWTSSLDVDPLLVKGADHIWWATPGESLTPDAGNGTTYFRRDDGSDYDNGFPIPTGPIPQYLFLRRDFCLPINTQADLTTRRLTVGGGSITLLNATDSTAVPDGAASVWLNGDTIAVVPGDESGSTVDINVPAPNFLFRGRNTLAMRVGDARSDERAAILYLATFDYAIDDSAIVTSLNTTTPFEQEQVQFYATNDGLSGRPPLNHAWTFGDGDSAAGTTVYHTYTMTSDYTATLTIEDSEFCTATTKMPITVLPFPLTIAKTATPNPVTAGETLRYQITVQNTSDVRALTDVTVADELPPGTTFSFCNPSCTSPTPPNRTVRWSSLGTLGTESSIVLDLYVTVDLTASGPLTNTTYGVQTHEVYTTGVPVEVEVLPPPCLQALTDLNVTGPTSGLINTLYPFTGTIAPSNASEPIYYTWTPTPTTGQSTPNATYQWATPGLHTLTLQAENCAPPDTVTIIATHVISISSPCPRPLTGTLIAGPTGGFTDTAYTFGSTITPTNATQPVTYTWSPAPTIGAQGMPTATYQWAAPGLYTITLQTENCGGTVIATHVISVSAPPITCPRPLAGVSITGPVSGITDTPYSFTGVITPANATEPITYTWIPSPLSGQSTPTTTYQWAAPGWYTITLMVENCGGTVLASHAISISAPPPITCPHPLVGASINGPTTGYTNTLYDFFAVPNPTNATEPVTPTWSPLPINGPNVHTATYQWATPGSYAITLTAENCGGAFSTTHTIDIQARQPALIYLPLTLRDYPDDAPDTCPGWSLTIAEPFDEDFDHADDRDWFTFQATAGISYTVRTQDLEIRADTVITLYDSTCATPLATNDDMSPTSYSRASQIGWRATATGPLHVLVQHYDPASFDADTGYSLVVYDEANPPPPTDDAPDFCTVARPIDHTYTNDFDHANDNDWFVFNATAGHTYTIATGNLGAQANTVLELWNDDCLTQLTIDANPADPEAQITWSATASGQLRVNVRHYDWTVYGPDTHYTVTIEEE